MSSHFDLRNVFLLSSTQNLLTTCHDVISIIVDLTSCTCCFKTMLVVFLPPPSDTATMITIILVHHQPL